MIAAIFFWIILIFSSILVILFSDRISNYFCIFLILVSSLSGYMILNDFSLKELNVTFIIDFIIFIYVVNIMINSNRYWPIWFASFQFITLASHIANWAFPIESAYFSFLFAGFWAIPALLSMAIGVVLDYRSGLFRDEEWAWLHAEKSK